MVSATSLGRQPSTVTALRLSTRKCWAMLLVDSMSSGTRSSGTVTSEASEPAAATMASA
jgi:hypothetical protein